MSLEKLAEKVYIDKSEHGESVYETVTGDEADVKAYWAEYRKYWSVCKPVASEPTTVGEKTTMHISRYKEQDD